jgi:hypothetical protein
MDHVKIPIINFNLEHHFKNIENSLFSTLNTAYWVKTFYQKNAFILNENGAKVESEAVVECVEAAAEIIGEEKPQPKHLLFNDDFVIFLKRKDAENPYFGLYITNDELMVKFVDNQTE